MKIAFFLNEFPTLSQPFVLNQITGMIDLGHEVDIYATHRFQTEKCHRQIDSYGLLEKTRFLGDVPARYTERAAKAIGRVLGSGLWRRPQLVVRSIVSLKDGRMAMDMRLLYRVLALAGRDRYDVIHCQFGTLGLLALELKKLGAIDGALVTSFRGYDLTKVLRNKPAYYDELFGNGAFFLPVSKSLANKLLVAGCPPDRIRILHSGIDCSSFRFTERCKPREEAVRLLGIGRFVEKKGWCDAIEAVVNARKSGRDIHFTIVGDGELREQIEGKISACQVEDAVTLTGWRDHNEIMQLLDKAHILIAPSITAGDGDQEGIPNVLKEAMATGLPVLSTWHSGIPELVEDGVSGYLVPERDVDALSDRLISLCDHPERWAEMGRNARNKVEAEFDMAKINKLLEELYGVAKDNQPGAQTRL
jgi:colanic acid/amylovoran/stewartan biosynthesis glycosyltransferase WcaL/AmsK/CpsK